MLPSALVFAALTAAAAWPSVAAGESVRREGLCLGPCAAPIHDVVEVRPGAFYAAKIDCKNCPYLRQTAHGAELLHRDLGLLFNISLSNDNHTIFVNGAPVFPTLATIPRPPAIHAPQILPNFSYANLSRALTCRNPSCAPNAPVDTRPGCAEWCHALQLGAVSLDYLYTANADDTVAHDSRSWTFAVDAIAGHSYAFHDDPSWTFDQPSQKMLQVRVAGVEDYKNPPGSSNLFEPASPGESVYQLRIVDVQLVARSYQFPPKTPLTAWAKLSRFFGNDVWESEHRLLFISKEWGLYGKEGTLRNMFGNFIHWENWHAFWLIFASSIGGILAIFCAYKFFFWIRHQRELMKWDGIDDVWDKLRRDREREEEEHSALLSARYRDDPSEGAGSSLQRYTDDVDTMKPLPTKPLPEKPLPDVPLIDA